MGIWKDALAALQSPTINQDIHHKTATWSIISTWSSASNNKMEKKTKTYSTYRSRKSLKHKSIIIIQTLTHALFHNELFLVFCSTLAGTARMALVGKKNFFYRLSMVPPLKIGKKVILFLPANGSLQLIK